MNNTKRVLIVDDEKRNVDLLNVRMKSLGHETETAKDGIEALAKLKLEIDLVLLDINMPGMDGFDVARKIRNDPETSDIPIIMVTALDDKETKLRAVEVGVNDFITKPVDNIELMVRTASLLKMKSAQDKSKSYQAKLEDKVIQRTAQLRKALSDSVDAQRKTYEAHLDTIHRLAIAAEYKDADTAEHIKRMSAYSKLLAIKMELSPGEVELVELASPMHDVGKIGIPDNILCKAGKLTPEEVGIMNQHTIFGGRILSGSSSELVQVGEIIALSHHEKWDGNGYPKGLAGEDIPKFGRICAVADVFDALTNKRSYKEDYSNEKSLEIIKEKQGNHLDPNIVDIFFKHVDEIISLQKSLKKI